jgi:hypothetical protein
VSPRESFRRGARRFVALPAGLLLLASTAAAQFGFRGLPYATPESYDGAFSFCRAVYRQSANGDGGGWSVDYPRADQNVSVRLSELTKTSISRTGEGEPNHVLVRLTAPELFRCPFVMMTEVGRLYIDDEEAATLREYLLKGGFLWADDFWGEYAWAAWDSQIRRVLPSGAFPYQDLALDHPIFRQVFTIPKVPQIPSINYWAGSGGDTSERRDSRVPHVRAIADERGRIMVLITHNTDFGDSWERETDNRQYFLTFSVDGYAFGINALVYALTH